MKAISTGLFIFCLLLSACGKLPFNQDQKDAANGEKTRTPNSNIDDRKIGPTNDDYFIVEATDGRKAELKFTNRSLDGRLVAYGTTGQKFEFHESRLTKNSLQQLHLFMTRDSQVSVRFQELRSHTSHAITTGSASTSGSSAQVKSHVSINEYDHASASHIVIVTTTSPFNRTVRLQTYYTNQAGHLVTARR